MYEAPRLKRFGTLQSMTLGGGAILLDPLGPDAAGDGCVSFVSDATGSTLVCIGVPAS